MVSIPINSMKKHILRFFIVNILYLNASIHTAFTTRIIRLAPKMTCTCPNSTTKPLFSCAQFAQHGIHFPAQNIKMTPPINHGASKLWYQPPFKKFIAIATASGLGGYALYNHHQKELSRQQHSTNTPSRTMHEPINNIIPQTTDPIPQNPHISESDHDKPHYGYKPDSRFKPKKRQTTPPSNSQPRPQNQPGTHDADSKISVSSSDGIKPYRPKIATPGTPARKPERIRR